MTRLPRTILSRNRSAQLAGPLNALLAGTPKDTVSDDPIAFVRRYSAKDDIEIAAVFASTLAFGRVAAFLPVIEKIMAVADANGGPARWIDRFGPKDAQGLAHLQYRWLKGGDLTLLAATLQAARAHHGSLQNMFVSAIEAKDKNIGPGLDKVIAELQHLAATTAPKYGFGSDFAQLSRGFRHGLPRPSKGSACKRWNMLLRWMVRKPSHPTDPDLGIWPLSAGKLVIPLDTHVLRTAQLVGLTRRTDGSWRTAVEVTQNLARIDPLDPVRFDFALAHIGISGRCLARHKPEICTPCPLASVCRFGTGRNRVTQPAGA